METTTTLSSENFRDKGLYIATPCFGGLMTTQFGSSLLGLSILLQAFKIRSFVSLLSSESLVARARNTQVAEFMAQDELTHLIFIDSDTEFEPEDVLRMLYSNKDVLCGPCPLKNLPISYAVSPALDDENQHCIVDDYFIELNKGGSGFMMIRKEVFKKMFEHYEALKYKVDKEIAKRVCSKYDNDSLTEKFKDSTYALFDTDIRDGKYNSEGYTFCERWKDIGGKVLMDPQIKLNHIGTHIFKGDISKVFVK
tara:strand:- start:4165 stop:4923 length:759 start_codon:yes stop_codon:yes gene_type:complete